MLMLSIVLGLIAWFLPIRLLISRYRSKDLTKTTNMPSDSEFVLPLTVLISMGCCSLAIFWQYHYQNYLLSRSDYSAMLDIMPTSVNASLFLLLMTIFLNGVTIYALRLKR